jgi:alpha-galactosidase
VNHLFRSLKVEENEFKGPFREKIAGINHMAWLLELEDADGNDMLPELKRRAIAILEKPAGGSQGPCKA